MNNDDLIKGIEKFQKDLSARVLLRLEELIPKISQITSMSDLVNEFDVANGYLSRLIDTLKLQNKDAWEIRRKKLLEDNDEL